MLLRAAVDQRVGVGILDQDGARCLSKQARDRLELIGESTRVPQDADELSFVVGDGELAKRSAASADEDHEVGTVDVVQLHVP